MPKNTLYIRGLDPGTVDRIHRAAQVRGMTLAQYITALSRLHDMAKSKTECQEELKKLGLEPVTF